MDKHINILKQLMIYWWNKDMFGSRKWEQLNEQIQQECFEGFLYDQLKYTNNGQTPKIIN